MNFSYHIVILNVVKNLKSASLCIQILRDAQDDNLIGKFHFDTLSKWIGWQQKKKVAGVLPPIIVCHSADYLPGCTSGRSFR